MRIGHCFGIPLWFKPRVELWICFGGVGPHCHPGQHVEVIPLFGWASFYRIVGGEQQSVEIKLRTWFRSFSLPAGCPHWFTGRLIFVNVSDRSAAKNFVPHGISIPTAKYDLRLVKEPDGTLTWED
jgi:hypothetical protein